VAPPRARRLSALAVNLSLSAATVALTLAAAEGLSRLLEKEPPRAAASYITVWDDGEFFTVSSAAAGWPPWEDYNRDGLRDREHAVDKPPGVRRIACLGDSVTLGYGLAPAESYPQVLQDVLDERGDAAEVFNVAFHGWSTRQQRLAYARIARKYRPDDVLLGVCLNDIPEMHNNLSRPPRLLQALHQRSALVRLAVGARRREVASVEELFEHPDGPAVRAAMDRFFDEVRALRRETDRDGARLGLVVFPFRFQLEAQAPAAVVQERILAFCATEKLPCVDLLPTLREVGPDAFHDYDHLSAAGARHVARSLARSSLLGAAAPETPAPGGVQTAAELVGRLAGTDARARASAAWALGDAEGVDAAARAALAAALSDSSAAVRAAAVRSLGRVETGPHAAALLVARLEDPAETVRWRAAEALAAVPLTASSVVDPLVRIAARADSPGRAGAAATLGRLGRQAQPAVAALVSALDDPRAEVRGRAAWALGEIGPDARTAVPGLVALARDAEVGWQVIDALGKIGPEARAALPALREALRGENASARWRAAAALGRLGADARAAAPDLALSLRDPVANVRFAAARALALVDAPPDFADALVSALHDGDSRVRAEAARTLGRGSYKAGPVRAALTEALADSDPAVRSEARRALQRLETR
jgi:HEAT repeat protein